MLVRATPIFPPHTPTRSTPSIDADGVLVGEVRERRPCPDIVGIGCHPSEQEGAVECRLVQEPSPCSRIPSEHPDELSVMWGPASLLIRESVDRGGALHRHCDGQREGDHPENQNCRKRRAGRNRAFAFLLRRCPNVVCQTRTPPSLEPQTADATAEALAGLQSTRARCRRGTISLKDLQAVRREVGDLAEDAGEPSSSRGWPCPQQQTLSTSFTHYARPLRAGSNSSGLTSRRRSCSTVPVRRITRAHRQASRQGRR